MNSAWVNHVSFGSTKKICRPKYVLRYWRQLGIGTPGIGYHELACLNTRLYQWSRQNRRNTYSSSQELCIRFTLCCVVVCHRARSSVHPPIHPSIHDWLVDWVDWWREQLNMPWSLGEVLPEHSTPKYYIYIYIYTRGRTWRQLTDLMSVHGSYLI